MHKPFIKNIRRIRNVITMGQPKEIVPSTGITGTPKERRYGGSCFANNNYRAFIAK